MVNTLYYGDNLYYLREFDDATVDLVYLDPPFNSKADYNLLFRTPKGDAVQAQTTAFKDTWHWDSPAAEAFDDVMASGSRAASMLRALRSFFGESDMMAYLAMMATRLIELHRILKPTGSLYLHCDPTASHYLKILLDAMFEPENFRSEVVWKRSTSHGNVSRGFGSLTDSILYYTKGPRFTWNQQFTKFSEEYIAQKFRGEDADGRRWQSVTLRNPGVRPNLRYPYRALNGVTYQPHPNGWSCNLERMQKYDREGRLHYPAKAGRQLRLKMYLDESQGVKLQNLWDDIPAVNSQAQERLGYPTQKPKALLERIIATSSNKGDLVLDPFCGCGTTIEAAEALGRSWIGIDVTHHAIDVIEGRLQNRCIGARYTVKGRPGDIEAAHDLARRDKYEFQWWANWLIGVQNYREHKKGADRGIDGVIYFRNGPWGTGQIVVSVKGGQHVDPSMISALAGTVEREKAQMGIFVCLADPSRRMRQDAAALGLVKTAQGKFQKIQIATVEDLLAGRRPPMPQAIETEAFRQPLRPTRRERALTPSDQLSLPLSFAGAKGKQDIQSFLSGKVLAGMTGA